MSITKANIVTQLNSRLGRSETATTLAEVIKAGLKFVSGLGRWPCLHTSKTDYALVSGTYYLAWPDNFRELDCIVLNDGTYDGEPLTEIKYEEWKKNREDETSANYDESEHYANRGKFFYLDPISDGSYTGKIDYWQWHPDQDTILFGDEFKEAVFNAVMGKYLEGKGPNFADAANFYLQIAVRECSGIPQDKKKSQIQYHDI